MRFLKMMILSICMISYCMSQYACKQDQSRPSIGGLVEDESTTLILVRHAEKEKGSNPNLNDSGLLRAQSLLELLSEVPLDRILSTDYNRTKQTAMPVAESQNLSIDIYDPSDFDNLIREIKANYRSKNILVVGHSNSTPTLANKLIGEEKYASFREDQYDYLIVVNISPTEEVNIKRVFMSDFLY